MSSVRWPAPQIRPATSADAPALVDLQRAVYQEDSWFVGDAAPGIGALTRKLRGLAPKMSLYLVATRQEEPVLLGGWLELHRLTPHKLKHVAMLTLAVAEPWRRQGVGGALLDEAYRWAGRVGVKKISLNVRAQNAAAVSLYEKQGFVLEGREREHVRVEGGYEDNLIMAKFLK